jgi:cell division protein FtsN
MVSTISHTFKSRTIEKEKIKIPIQVFKPFTIQVAAYLKQKHAKRYVGILKKKEIDARIKKVYGGGKTWFVVRISEFTDKKSAVAYGRKLKKQKIIDDFFVNNK